MSKKIIICQNILPDYRVDLFNEIKLVYPEIDLEVVSVKNGAKTMLFKNSIIKDLKIFNRFHINIGLGKIISKADVVILMWDIHWISFMLLLFRVNRFKIVLWGQGVTNSKNRFSGILRRITAFKSDALLFYDEDRRNKFCNGNKILQEKSYVAINTLVIKNTMRSKEPRNIILFVGRLNKNKRPTDLIKSYIMLTDKLKKAFKLVFVGEGSEMEELLRIVNDNDLKEKVEVLGPIYDHKKLEELFKKSICTVIPGTVGLGVVHSFAYGVPLITTPFRNHGPEFSHCNEFNSCFYDGTVDSLSFTLSKELENTKNLEQKGINAFNYYLKNLSFNNWFEGFRDAVFN